MGMMGCTGSRSYGKHKRTSDKHYHHHKHGHHNGSGEVVLMNGELQQWNASVRLLHVRICSCFSELQGEEWSGEANEKNHRHNVLFTYVHVPSINLSVCLSVYLFVCLLFCTSIYVCQLICSLRQS